MLRARSAATRLSGIVAQGFGIRGLRSTATSAARVLCADGVSPRCAEIFQDRGHRTVESGGLSMEDLKTELPKYDAIIVRSATKLPAEAFKYATSLKVIGRAGVGVDNIDLDAATRHGIIVQNTPGGNTYAAAELAFSLLVSLARQVPASNQSLLEGRWDRKLYKGRELKGKTIGIIGLGSIGQCMASLCRALGMRIVAYDPVATVETATAAGAEQLFATVEDLMAVSDVVSLHVPGGPSTQGMIGREQLKAAKPGCLLVNAARGGVVDADALLEAIEQGWVGGAALDVYDKEPPSTPATVKLVSMPQVVCTPHLGASTEEAQVKVAEQIAEQVCDVLDGKKYIGVVNAKHVALSQQTEGKQVAGLARSLGHLASSILEGKVDYIDVELSPALAAKNPAYEELVRSAVLAGALPNIRQDIAESDVNLINAGALAQTNHVGCNVATMEDGEAADFETQVQVTVSSASGQRSVRGALDGGQARVVGVDHWSSFPSFAPQGSVLLVQNTDKPGAIGQVARILANEGINIAQMSVARQHPGSPALCVLLLDDRVTKATRQRIATQDGIYSVATASF